jgi:hypothetical protein
MSKLIENASQSNADLINAIVPPTAGVSAGGGIHVIIPDNWQDLISQGQTVDGCTYASIGFDGSLPIDDSVQTLLETPAIITKLPPQLQIQATALNVQINQVVSNPVVSDPIITEQVALKGD